MPEVMPMFFFSINNRQLKHTLTQFLFNQFIVHLHLLHITNALVCLRWLCMLERVQFKIAILTHKSCMDSCHNTSVYLIASLDLHDHRALRSSGTSRLVVPPVITIRAFPVVGPRIWNDLQLMWCLLIHCLQSASGWKLVFFTESFPGCFLDVK